MKAIKEEYRRFRKWQENPINYQDSHENHHCCNCGVDMENNYCPRCGQKAVYGPITWKSVRQGVLDVWGVSTRSLPYTLWQLIWRPGYLMRDYISGKRQVSFPPVKMLLLVGVVAFLIDNLTDPEQTVQTVAVTSTGIRYYIDVVSNWLDVHYAWSLLIAFCYLIIPVWSLFREAPKYPHHTLPQGFFIHVFVATQFLLVTMLFYLITFFLFPKYNGEYFAGFVFLLIIPLLLLMDYKQLFGYNWWGTLWRAIMVVPMALMFFRALVQFGRAFLRLVEHGMGKQFWEYVLMGIDGAVLLWLVMEIVGVINRKEWRHSGWWHVVKRPVLIALILAVTDSACFYFGLSGAVVDLYNTYLSVSS